MNRLHLMRFGVEVYQLWQQVRSVLHMAFVIPCAKRSHAQFQDIVTTYLHSEDGVVSFRYEEFPCWVDSYVWRFGGYADWEAFCISVYYMGDKKPMKALLID